MGEVLLMAPIACFLFENTSRVLLQCTRLRWIVVTLCPLTLCWTCSLTLVSLVTMDRGHTLPPHHSLCFRAVCSMYPSP